MPSWMKFAGLWGLAAIAALTLSWVAVSQVRDRVIQPVTVVPTTMVALGSEATDATVVVVEPSLDPQTASGSSTTPTAAEPSAEQSTTSTTRATSASPAVTSTTAVSQTTSTTTQATTTTTRSPQTTATTVAGSTSSHSTPGGSVTISSTPGVVSFVSAIPQSGFTTDLRDMGPERVRVRFVSATVIFEFEARWDDGRLDIETSEHTP